MRYRTPSGFRAALEERLRATAATSEALLQRTRKFVTFERFLARIQFPGDDRWLLKGGFALQLRLGNRARTTKDVDLSANLGDFGRSDLSPEEVGDVLADAASRDAGDFFKFEVGFSRELSLRVGPVRAFRYPVNGLLDGRTFERFHIDAGIGDPVALPPVLLPPSGLLEFAGLPAVEFRAIALEQHLAEKVHAMTLPREGAENTRTRDLADLMILLDLGSSDPQSVCRAVHAVFGTRKTHEVPSEIEDPPRAWEPEFGLLASELGLAQATVEEAMGRLNKFWKALPWGRS